MNRPLTNAALTDTALIEHLPSWGVLLLESHHSSTFKMDWRTHRFLKIVFVLAGKGEFQFEKRSHSFEPGDVIVVPPETPNRIEDAPSSASSLYICCLATSLFAFDLELIDNFEVRRIEKEKSFSKKVAASMRRISFAQNSIRRLRSVAMVSEAIDLVQLVLKQPDPVRMKNHSQLHDQEMKRYISSLGNEFFEVTSIGDAAAGLGMPRRTFTKLFLELTGETWLQYVRRLAINHAVTRLFESDSSVTSVAFECGFNDLSTFYRQFKSKMNMSPAAFRSKHRT